MSYEMFTKLLWALPFLVLLGAIAIFPLLCRRWWDKNYPKIALGLGLLVVMHYLLQVRTPGSLIQAGMEYFSFIALIGSLFVVSGGIYIQTAGEVTPLFNCFFLFSASVLSNLLGTTGASMVFIRPWIRMNKYRLTTFHMVFFIFLIGNIGGALTPIGDPPLFLGYLEGVPFFWVVQHIWGVWLLTVGILLAVFFVIDRHNFLRASAAVRERETHQTHSWKIRGKRNLIFIATIISAVFILHPPFVREIIMIIAAFLSWKFTPRDVHEANDFNFGPIREVAILFLGIFATMVPALEWLETYGGQLGIRTPGEFYWWTGMLSSMLDNAPTYLNFFTLASGLFAGDSGRHTAAILLAREPVHVLAISVGAVFFGAMTYIGNGPNFLIKAIAEHHKIKMPSFFGYLFRFSLPFLLPVFVLIWFLFFKS